MVDRRVACVVELLQVFIWKSRTKLYSIVTGINMATSRTQEVPFSEEQEGMVVPPYLSCYTAVRREVKSRWAQ